MDALEVPSETLLQLADALEAGHVRGPLTRFGLRAFTTSVGAVRALEDLRLKLGSEAELAGICRLLVAERAAATARAPRVELVWTGPERIGSSSRDTKIVVSELFGRARRSVLVSSYSLGRGASLFAPLAARMEEIPALRVRMFFDITVGVDPLAAPRTRGEYEARFVQRFLRWQWPWPHLPEVFHDPRTLDNERISFHAKCIVVDDEVALVTSANTSVAAQEDNIEAGVLIEDRLFAISLAKQFDDLVTARLLVPMEGLSERR